MVKELLKNPFFLGSWLRWDKKDDYFVQAPGPWLSRSLVVGLKVLYRLKIDSILIRGENKLK